MRSRLATCLLFMLIGATACGDKRPSPVWESVELIRAPGVHVRLRYRKRATSSDTRWIGLEFVNTTSKPISLREIQFRFDYELADRTSGGLFNQHVPGVLPPSWQKRPVVLPPGSTRLSSGISALASARLPLTTTAGHKLSVRVNADILLNELDGHNTGDSGIRIELSWEPLDDAGIDAVRKRLAGWMTDPSDDGASEWLLEGWLRKPLIASHLTAKQVIAALTYRKRHGMARGVLPAYLSTRFADTPLVRQHFLQRLKAGDLDALTDIRSHRHREASRIWSPAYVEAVVRLIEKTPKAWKNGFALLEAHGTPQVADQKLARRLRTAVEARNVLVRSTTPRSQTWPRYPEGFDYLARCRDPGVIPKLAAKLSDRSVHRSIVGYPRLFSFVGGGVWGKRPLPSRICDFALDAVLKLQGRELAKVYAQAGFTLDFNSSASDEDIARSFHKMRDRMISAMRRELDR